MNLLRRNYGFSVSYRTIKSIFAALFKAVIFKLKLFFSYILLFSLVLRPIYNVGYLAYFELNIDYIVNTFCVNKEQPKLQCNGKCHLKKQLALATNIDTSENRSIFNSFEAAFLPVYFQKFNYNDLNVNFRSSIVNNWHYKEHYLQLAKDGLDPPPKTV